MGSRGRELAGRSVAPLASSVLRAKLRAPTPPEHFVRRDRLHRLMDEVASTPLTLVVAPAGAGKTSLLSGWTAESGTPTCWLTLDETDRGPAQLWSGVIDALATRILGCGEQARALLQHTESVLAGIDNLVEDLDLLLASSTVLVLDDLHLVDDDEAVNASLAYFVQHVPPLLHVVLASRRVPRLPLDRLRARGRVGEVHFAQLRFSLAEAAEMLTRLAPAMSEEDVSTTAAQSEGWAAGVQLAALAARSARALDEPNPASAGTDLLIHDYVWHEVLASEDPDLVRVMSDTAVVERIDPSLAHALTGRADAGDVLIRAEARGLFVSRLGPEGWFEVHSLVRAALLGEQARTSPGRAAEQHRRAARWFEVAGEAALSLEHWLLAGEPRSALRLLAANHGPLYDAGGEATIRHTIAAIPLEAATADLESMIEFAWCHLLVSRRRFVELVDQVSWWAEHEGESDPALLGRATVLESIAATVTGRSVEGGRLARQALREFGDGWWRDPLGRFAWNGVAREIALTESWSDDADTVRQAGLALSRDPPRRIALEGTRAVGEALAGRPVDALRVAAGVRGAVAVDNMTVLDAELAAAEALAHREMGERSRALVELEALAEAPAETMLYCKVLATLELVAAHLDVDDFIAARRSFTQAETLILNESFGPDGHLWLARIGARLALATGDLELGRSWADQIDDDFWGPATTARVQLAAGVPSSAFATLDMAITRCPRHEVVLGLLRAQSASHREDALRFLAGAVECATANGILQTVASEGPALVQLVEVAAWQVPQPWMERLRRAAVGGGSRDPQTTLEPLTERERDVLRFLPSRLTIGEIANELYISVNTLKFHLKVIYRKLGVSSRAQAADLARRPVSAGSDERR